MKQNHKTFLTRKRWIGLIVLILATIFTAIYACKTNIDPAPATIAGSFGSIAALLLISYILKVRDDLFFCGLLFVYFASPVGSVLNLYRSVDLYDKVVHFFSGLLLASLGALAGCVAFTGSQLHVVKITDTHGAQGMAITSAHDIKTLMQQAGIAAPDTEDELEITENAGLDQIHILRAYTVPVTVDGGVQEVVVTGGTVGDVLAEAGITLGPDDWIEPALDTPAQENTMVTIQRVRYEEYTQDEVIPTETQYVETSLFYRKQSKEQLIQQGSDGLCSVSYRETYVDGELTDTTETNRETVIEMVPTIIKHYDEQAPVSSFVGPEIVDGKPCEGIAATYTAQRSTGYSASPTAKGSSGRRLTYGTVAVNPNVIPYGSLMYITSADGRFVYGYAYAADTGTAMMTGSAFIDLYYETYSESVDNAVIAVNVYVLDSDTAAKYKEENDAILEADNTPGL